MPYPLLPKIKSRHEAAEYQRKIDIFIRADEIISTVWRSISHPRVGMLYDCDQDRLLTSLYVVCPDTRVKLFIGHDSAGNAGVMLRPSDAALLARSDEDVARLVGEEKEEGTLVDASLLVTSPITGRAYGVLARRFYYGKTDTHMVWAMARAAPADPEENDAVDICLAFVHMLSQPK